MRLYPVCMGTYANHFNPEGMDPMFCDAAPEVSADGLRCSNDACIWSHRQVPEREWNRRNCQGSAVDSGLGCHWRVRRESM